MDNESYCRSIPKVELHAHLNGSLSHTTLQTLYRLRNSSGADTAEPMLGLEDHVTFEECFKVFEIAHALTITPQAVFIATCDVIKEFSEDNVIYLELRSTPRCVEGSMTKVQYVEAMIKAVNECKALYPGILVKLLISVDRKRGEQAAKENVELAINFAKQYPQYIVGIDLSGDPTKGGAFLESLEAARKIGLKIAAHCAEIPNVQDTVDILNFKPDRLGHCTCIHPALNGSQELFEMLLKLKIPVELCLTSNLKCKTVLSYDAHHFKYFYEARHPICIATDDKGVFNTSLSKEFYIVMSTFGIGREDLLKLCKSAVHCSFASEDEKMNLLSIIENYN